MSIKNEEFKIHALSKEILEVSKCNLCSDKIEDAIVIMSDNKIIFLCNSCIPVPFELSL